MSRLTEIDTLEENEEIEIRSAAALLPLAWTANLPDYILAPAIKLRPSIFTI